MTLMGKAVWKAVCRWAGDRGEMNPLRKFTDDCLPLGEKTFRRRLNDDGWLFSELVTMQQELKSKELQQIIDAKFKESME